MAVVDYSGSSVKDEVITNIVRLINQQGRKHSEFDYLFGTSIGTMNKKINGKRDISLDDFFGIVNELNVTVDAVVPDRFLGYGNRNKDYAGIELDGLFFNVVNYNVNTGNGEYIIKSGSGYELNNQMVHFIKWKGLMLVVDSGTVVVDGVEFITGKNYIIDNPKEISLSGNCLITVFFKGMSPKEIEDRLSAIKNQLKVSDAFNLVSFLDYGSSPMLVIDRDLNIKHANNEAISVLGLQLMASNIKDCLRLNQYFEPICSVIEIFVGTSSREYILEHNKFSWRLMKNINEDTILIIGTILSKSESKQVKTIGKTFSSAEVKKIPGKLTFTENSHGDTQFAIV